MIFDSKTDSPHSFVVTLETKIMKDILVSNLPVVGPLDDHVADAANEPTMFDRKTARRAEIKRSNYGARFVQFRRQYTIKCLAGCLHNC